MPAMDTSITSPSQLTIVESDEFDVRDQGGWGCDDYPFGIVEQLRVMSKEAGMHLEDNTGTFTLYLVALYKTSFPVRFASLIGNV